MSLVHPHQPRVGKFRRDGRPSYSGYSNMGASHNFNYDNHGYNTKLGISNHDSYRDLTQNYMPEELNYDSVGHHVVPNPKRRKISALSSDSTGRPHTYQNDLINHAGHCKPLEYYTTYCGAPVVCNNSASIVEKRHDGSNGYASASSKRDRSMFEDEDAVFMSRDEIERCSPSRKDGIDPVREAHLRYSYCAFLQDLGVRLDIPQTTIGTAMVLCHRFFLRRSHASHDRFLIATAVLFLTSKSEETARPLNDVLRVACEVLHGQDFTLLSYMLPIDWFEQYRERVIDAEQLILTTLNFELNVQHPYDSLTTTLQKIGFSESVLVNLALNLVSEGLRSSLWLQFKPHQIAAGAAYLAAKFLNMNLDSCHSVWHQFHTPPSVLKDVAHQLMELF